MRTLAFAALLAALAAAPASAAELHRPTDKWVLDYGASACTAIRSYGTAEKPLTLAFRPSPNGTVVRLMVVRRGDGGPGRHFPLRTSVTGKERLTGLRFTPRRSKSDIVWINFRRPDLEALRAPQSLSLTSPEWTGGSFALPGIGKVLDALDRCNADLRKHWNVDETAAQLSKPAEPVKLLHSYFSDADYPSQAMREGKSGTTQMMLMIDETGAVKDCLVEQTSGIATLDAMGCGALIERARFRPALDRDGKPAKSVHTARIQWRLGFG
jgi:TonB family protein